MPTAGAHSAAAATLASTLAIAPSAPRCRSSLFRGHHSRRWLFLYVLVLFFIAVVELVVIARNHLAIDLRIANDIPDLGAARYPCLLFDKVAQVVLIVMMSMLRQRREIILVFVDNLFFHLPVARSEACRWSSAAAS